MKLLTRWFITTAIVMIIANYLKGVTVDNLFTGFCVAVFLGILNAILKPILVFFTLPITIVTLGLFLLVVNAIIILVCDKFIDGFTIDKFSTAFWFSIILSISQSIVYKFTDEKK